MQFFNEIIFRFIFYTLPHNGFSDALGIFCAEYLSYFLIIGFLFLVLSQRSWRHRMYFFCEASLAIILSSGIITGFFKFFYYDPRPFMFYYFTPLINETGWSFPSGHSAFFYALALIIWDTDHTWGTVYFILVILMTSARVFVGVHWPIDIIAGAFVGIISAIAIRALLKSTRDQLKL